MAVAQQADSPETDEWVFMAKGLLGQFGSETTAVIDGPKTFERDLAVVAKNRLC